MPRSGRKTASYSPAARKTAPSPCHVPTDARVTGRSAPCPPLPVSPDQGVGRRVVRELRLLVRLQLARDPLREHLAELDPPLVEGVDVPDSPGGEDRMLVQRDELAERLREDRGGRMVAFEDPVRDEPVRRPFGCDLLRGLAERERLGLREHVRRE